MHGSRAPYDQMAPQLCLFYVPGQPSKKTLFEKPWSDGEEITTGKTGTTFCIRSGHKINWFLAFEALPVFPVVTIRHISRDKGQKAGPQREREQRESSYSRGANPQERRPNGRRLPKAASEPLRMTDRRISGGLRLSRPPSISLSARLGGRLA